VRSDRGFDGDAADGAGVALTPRLAHILVALAALGLGVTSCRSPSKSFIILTLRSADPAPIAGVTEVVVVATQVPTLSKTLIYPPIDAATLTIDQVTRTDLSVSFSGGQSGTVSLDVQARNAAGCTIGEGATTALIRKGDVATASVDLGVANDCSAADGGTDAQGDSFPGCDPATPMCATATQTCQVNCTKRVGECVAGGTGAPGASCSTNADCAPGSQCFDYSGTGCAVKVCLRFCNDDGMCGTGSSGSDAGTAGDAGAMSVADAGAAAPADAGAADAGAADAPADAAKAPAAAGPAAVGAQSFCQGPVECDGVATAYHTCTFACDPRPAAVSNNSTGCPKGLACLVVGNMDQVDCACAEPTRTGMDGASCTGSVDCAPGYICNLMGDARTCRALCRCNSNLMNCTVGNECTGGKLCSALANDTTFGVCL
jgi:hypothetical protein